MKNNFDDLKKIIEDNAVVFSDVTNIAWFLDWLKDNTFIYDEFESYALQLKHSGKHSQYSARAIIHKMRWDRLFTDVGSKYKINFNCTPYMARLAMIKNKELTNLFIKRNNVKED